MNNIITTICALYFSLMASAQINYAINGTTIKISDGEKVYLHTVDGNTKNLIDSAIVTNNYFTFKGTQLKTGVAHVTLQKSSFGYKSFPIIILENGIINFSLDNKKQLELR